jgi:hypothetical protein
MAEPCIRQVCIMLCIVRISDFRHQAVYVQCLFMQQSGYTQQQQSHTTVSCVCSTAADLYGVPCLKAVWCCGGDAPVAGCMQA